jgi:hypothetical protein
VKPQISELTLPRVLRPQSMDSSISLGRSVSGFQATFFGMLSVWSVSFLEDMTPTSWVTNLQDCDARQCLRSHYYAQTVFPDPSHLFGYATGRDEKI